MGCDDYPPRRSSQDIAYDRMRDLLGQAQGIVSYGRTFLNEYERRGLRIRQLEADLVETRTQVTNALRISALMLEALGGRHVITDADAERVDTFPEVFIEHRGFDRVLTLGSATLKEKR